MNPVVIAILVVIALIVGAAIGFLIAKNLIERKQQATQEGLQKVIAKAQNQAKEFVLSAHEQIALDKEKFERQTTNQQNELRIEKEQLRQEKLSIKQKEDAIEKKELYIAKREETLAQKIEQNNELKQQLKEREEERKAQFGERQEALELKYQQHQDQLLLKEQELSVLHAQVLETIERVAQLTQSDAKQQLLQTIEEDAKKDAVKILKDIQEETLTTAEQRARSIIAAAIQKGGVEYASELSISTVVLPNDDMKGRIIGREGRNIRALEQATGVDFVVDDTPEAIVLSGFDPVRREIAKLTLEKLISDGRIHPTRIEETVEKMRKDIEVKIKESGEAAVYELGIFGMHPEIVKTLGRLKYRTSYGQNQLSHSIETAKFAGYIGAELGADVEVCKRGALLHDLGKALDYEIEGTHIQIGADLCRKYNESQAVIHCIEAHHFDIEMETVEAVIVQIADAISGARPGARRESFGNYVKRLEQLEKIANSYKGVDKSFAVQAGRELRIIVKPTEVDDTAAMFMAREVAKQIETEMQYPGQIKVNVIRELRHTEVAK
ncbi:MAG: ribonuclease Y [Clostridiales bacterium]|jgi:ribonuclease Y|nr:ribonuclease Y [Clostridiales bacterium]